MNKNNLIIHGHPARGREVIEILEMLGGKNTYNLSGDEDVWYVLADGKIIHFLQYLFYKGEKGYSLEEFLRKFPYKVGDRVMIPEYESELRINEMKWDGTTIVYRLDPADETEWFTAEELKAWNCDEELKQEVIKRKNVSQLTFGDKIYKLRKDWVEVLIVTNIKQLNKLNLHNGNIYMIEFVDDEGDCGSIKTIGNIEAFKIDEESHIFTNIDDIQHLILNRIETLKVQLEKIKI